VEQAIPEKLSIASYSTREMYPAAQRFLAEMSQHFQRAINRATNMTFRIRCSVGDGILKASDLRECLSRVRFENQDLNMAVERYICRSTPDYAALSLPAGPVVTDIIKWAAAVFESSSGMTSRGHFQAICLLHSRYTSPIAGAPTSVLLSTLLAAGGVT
jgi:hypothetical protein